MIAIVHQQQAVHVHGTNVIQNGHPVVTVNGDLYAVIEVETND